MAHTEDFKRTLVDEALNRTPPGGFPELEKRHHLRSGTLFDWVEQYGSDLPPRPFSAQHIWIGTTALTEDEFGAYFDHDPAYWTLEVDEIENASGDVTGCGFSLDLGEKFLYDDDLLQVLWRPAPVPVRELIDEMTLGSAASLQRLVAECRAHGIATANAGFAYADPAQPVHDARKSYNGLPYLGLFPTD